MEKYVILILIILVAGTFGGIVRYLNTVDITEPTNWKAVLKYVLTGIGSATLIPLFLNMLSSNLLAGDEIAILNYFIFAGFCFIGAFLSEKFISTIGERILNEVKQVKKEQQENEGKIDALIENESEPEEDMQEKSEKVKNILTERRSKTDNTKDHLMMEVLDSFRNSQYKFRSSKGISTELGYPEEMVSNTIKTLEENALLRSVSRTRDNKVLWGITGLGKTMKSSQHDK
jgi:hypothetical protein